MPLKPFVNRTKELRSLDTSKAKLTVLFGRRRVGKTTLIERWGADKRYAYSQAIEASDEQQLAQLVADLAPVLPTGVVPRSWPELLSALALIRRPTAIVLDEFPYLVRTDPSLPSRLQKWVDHDQPDHVRLVLLGSSQSMMHGLFLESNSPLYDRADLVIRLEPMSYAHYCEAIGCDPESSRSFLNYSMTGGVPRYWRYVDGLNDPIDVADALFFDKTARLDDEPDRLLKDEDILGQQAKSIMEAIGRGASRPSEIAGRMAIPQTGLSKPLSVLMRCDLVRRVVPFGESSRNTKRTLYMINDHALRFWYQVYSPHRSRWHLYDRETKLKLIRDHASKVAEIDFLRIYRDAAPYWQGKELEFDCVRHDPRHLKSLIVSEMKFRPLTKTERSAIETSLTEKFARCALTSDYRLSRVEVLDQSDILAKLARP